jgi:hypothetical protein
VTVTSAPDDGVVTTSRRLRALVAALAVAATGAVAAAPDAVAAPARIPAAAFGMHFIGWGTHAYPSMPFGSARVWDTGVSWADLQPTPDGWDADALGRLDAIVAGYRSHHVDPMITLGMTPAWAANTASCNPAYKTYGVGTCPPSATGPSSPWASYVQMLSLRYTGKVRYFELWNEPSLRNGWNGTIATLVALEKTAAAVLHPNAQKLVGPSIAFTNVSPQKGLDWLAAFCKAGGGGPLDVIGLHLYPTDKVAKARYGPEWTMTQLAAARAVLAKHHVSKPVWNTEVNVGRAQTGTTFGGMTGAAQVARTFVLATQNRVKRTFWYAADDRSWGGTWLEASDYSTLTYAGRAERTAYNLLVGARPYGCKRVTMGTHQWRYTCKYHLANGRNMIAVWTTGSSYTIHPPRHTTSYYDAIGTHRSTSHARRLKVTGAPLYIVGTFSLSSAG